MSTSPASPRTVTVSGLLADWPAARPSALPVVGSECGAAVVAASTMSTLLAPAPTTTGAALTPAGRPLSSIVTAASKPALRVIVARTLAVPPCINTTLSVASVNVKVAAGGGLTITGGGEPPPVSGSAGSPSEPPQAARPSASMAASVIDRIVYFT